MSGSIDHSGIPSRDMEQLFQSRDSSTYFSRRTFFQGKAYRYPDRVVFQLEPIDRLGREKSRHQVFFGQLEGQWFHERQTDSISVAIKPIPNYPQDRYKVLHEVAMHQYLRENDLPALDVVGIMLTGAKPVWAEQDNKEGYDDEYREPYGYVISRTEDDMDTIDNLKWSGLTIEQAGSRMSYVLDTLALLHSHYVFHGDTEFRNIAIADSGRSIRLIDLEFARSFRDARIDVDAITEKINLDFSCVAKSLDEHIGYLFHDHDGNKQPLEAYRFMLDYLLLPYGERLQRIGVPHDDALALAYKQTVLMQLDTARSIEAAIRQNG